jgi:hypothetical protein
MKGTMEKMWGRGKGRGKALKGQKKKVGKRRGWEEMNNGQCNWWHMEKVSWWMKIVFHGWIEQTKCNYGWNGIINTWIKLTLKSEIDHNGI